MNFTSYKSTNISTHLMVTTHSNEQCMTSKLLIRNAVKKSHAKESRNKPIYLFKERIKYKTIAFSKKLPCTNFQCDNTPTLLSCVNCTDRHEHSNIQIKDILLFRFTLFVTLTQAINLEHVQTICIMCNENDVIAVPLDALFEINTQLMSYKSNPNFDSEPNLLKLLVFVIHGMNKFKFYLFNDIINSLLQWNILKFSLYGKVIISKPYSSTSKCNSSISITRVIKGLIFLITLFNSNSLSLAQNLSSTPGANTLTNSSLSMTSNLGINLQSSSNMQVFQIFTTFNQLTFLFNWALTSVVLGPQKMINSIFHSRRDSMYLMVEPQNVGQVLKISLRPRHSQYIIYNSTIKCPVKLGRAKSSPKRHHRHSSPDFEFVSLSLVLLVTFLFMARKFLVSSLYRVLITLLKIYLHFSDYFSSCLAFLDALIFRPFSPSTEVPIFYRFALGQRRSTRASRLMCPSPAPSPSTESDGELISDPESLNSNDGRGEVLDPLDVAKFIKHLYKISNPATYLSILSSGRDEDGTEPDVQTLLKWVGAPLNVFRYDPNLTLAEQTKFNLLPRPVGPKCGNVAAAGKVKMIPSKRDKIKWKLKRNNTVRKSATNKTTDTKSCQSPIPFTNESPPLRSEAYFLNSLVPGSEKFVRRKPAINQRIELCQETPPTCSICLEDYEDGHFLWRLPSCRHTYHRDCIYSWVSKNPTCPICRSCIYVNYPYNP